MTFSKQIFTLILMSSGLMAFAPQPNLEGTKCHVTPTYIDMYYGLGSRFEAITKSELNQAKTVADFFKPGEVQPLLNYTSVEIVLIENDKQTDQRMENDFFHLSEEQVNWLKNMDYATHFLVRTYFQALDPETGKIEQQRSEPHFTVVPETQANYSLGERAFIDFITQENRGNTANLSEDDLGFAKLAFTVNEDGTLSNFKLDRSTGSTKIDEAIVKIVKYAPGIWVPARNAQGQVVKQQLVLTIGAGGC